MGLIRTVKCDVSGCDNRVEARKPDEGYKLWGMVTGDFVNESSGDNTAYICPVHMNNIKSLLNGGEHNGMD